MAVLRTTLSVVVAVLACWLVPTAATASAPVTAPADCAPLDLSDPAAVRSNTAEVRKRAEAVTDVFAGQVEEVRARHSVGGGEGKADQSGNDAPSSRPDVRTTGWEHRVQVRNPFRSDRQLGDMVIVVTKPVADGGLGPLDEGEIYLFFVTDEKGKDIVARPCSGTQRLRPYTADLRDALEAALAEPEQETTPDYTLSAPDGGARSTPALGRLAAPGAAVAIIGVLGLLVLARVGSRRT